MWPNPQETIIVWHSGPSFILSVQEVTIQNFCSVSQQRKFIHYYECYEIAFYQE